MMELKRIEGATRTLAAPQDWKEDEQGKVYGLPIRDCVDEYGNKWMVSAWSPSPDEMQRMINGESIKLMVAGTMHPVVSLCVGDL